MTNDLNPSSDGTARRPGFDAWAAALAPHRTTVVLGAPGSGKTLFALQALVTAARQGEPGVYASFGTVPSPISYFSAQFGWDLRKLQAEGRLVVLNPIPPEKGIEATLPALGRAAKSLGAQRLALDSLQLAPYLPDPVAESRQLIHLRDWLIENQFTAVLATRLGENDPAQRRRRALLQLLSDCTVALELVGSGSNAARWLRVLKYRAAPFVDSEFPFFIGNRGIELLVTETASPASSGAELCAGLQTELTEARRLFTQGIQSLDRFLEIKQAELDFMIEKNASCPPHATNGSGERSQ